MGAWIVHDLLTTGRRVRGTMRDPAKAAHLTALPGARERLELVRADLLDAESLRAAAQGCGTCLHTASPYVLTVADPERDLVRSAMDGTRHALAACHAAGITRVILTSSQTAITDAPRTDRVFTEADWNTTSHLKRNPHYYSKVLAERAA